MPERGIRGMGPNAEESGLPQTSIDGSLSSYSRKPVNSVPNNDQSLINQALYLVLSQARGANGLLCDKIKPDHFEFISNYRSPVSAALCRLSSLPELFLFYRPNNANVLFSVGWNRFLYGIKHKTNIKLQSNDIDMDLYN
ncbi:MAG: hypothetical protein ACN4GM_15925 [Gammaproteobacteria bacterium]